jgi:hypothetical protein
MDARLDAITRQKVDDLAKHFRQPRAAVLCHIMQWGLRRGETLDQGESQGPVRHLSLYVPSELHEQVEKAATTAGVKGAQWLRHMVRQIAITDFPVSWQEATALVTTSFTLVGSKADLLLVRKGGYTSAVRCA